MRSLFQGLVATAESADTLFNRPGRLMSFRARLTTFFLLIVVIPMAAVGFLVFTLINDSQQGKAQARANGIASAAAGVYEQASRSASLDAKTLARELEHTGASGIPGRVAELTNQAGFARVTVSAGTRTLADVGNRTAVAPGLAIVRTSGSTKTRSIMLSQLTAAQYADQLNGRGFQIVVRQGGQTLSSTLAGIDHVAMPRSGTIKIGGATYQAITLAFSGFGPTPVHVTVLSDEAVTGGSLGTDRLVAALFILAFFVLAVCFTMLASRALQAQLSRFLEAARRLGSGDFSSPIRTHGHDEFAALGDEFNKMSVQLSNRLDELRLEQARVRRSIRNIGKAFASNLDRGALLQLALETAMDATVAGRGRITAREHAADPLAEVTRSGTLDGLEEAIASSEEEALHTGDIGEASAGEVSVATVALAPIAPGAPTHGLITVCRSGRPFTEDDRELLRSLAARAALALANVKLHLDVQRQAITDDLTGLATHGHFQSLLGAEIEEVRRYQYPVGLVMLDIDDFKSINDLYGHQQGDVVLRCVAQVLRDNSRDVDVPARYGGEELALILPHTDLDGTFVIAERAREAIEQMQVPLLDRDGALQVTASFGVAASVDGSKDELIAAADGALYAAKREGKNRTVKASSQTANVLGGR
jgi:diguanylate cyclase (GGDEF)-like protein